MSNPLEKCLGSMNSLIQKNGNRGSQSIQSFISKLHVAKESNSSSILS